MMRLMNVVKESAVLSSAYYHDVRRANVIRLRAEARMRKQLLANKRGTLPFSPIERAPPSAGLDDTYVSNLQYGSRDAIPQSERDNPHLEIDAIAPAGSHQVPDDDDDDGLGGTSMAAKRQLFTDAVANTRTLPTEENNKTDQGTLQTIKVTSRSNSLADMSSIIPTASIMPKEPMPQESISRGALRDKAHRPTSIGLPPLGTSVIHYKPGMSVTMAGGSAPASPTASIRMGHHQPTQDIFTNSIRFDDVDGEIVDLRQGGGGVGFSNSVAAEGQSGANRRLGNNSSPTLQHADPMVPPNANAYSMAEIFLDSVKVPMSVFIAKGPNTIPTVPSARRFAVKVAMLCLTAYSRLPQQTPLHLLPTKAENFIINNNPPPPAGSNAKPTPESITNSYFGLGGVAVTRDEYCFLADRLGHQALFKRKKLFEGQPFGSAGFSPEFPVFMAASSRAVATPVTVESRARSTELSPSGTSHPPQSPSDSPNIGHASAAQQQQQFTFGFSHPANLRDEVRRREIGRSAQRNALTLSLRILHIAEFLQYAQAVRFFSLYIGSAFFAGKNVEELLEVFDVTPRPYPNVYGSPATSSSAGGSGPGSQQGKPAATIPSLIRAGYWRPSRAAAGAGGAGFFPNESAGHVLSQGPIVPTLVAVADTEVNPFFDLERPPTQTMPREEDADVSKTPTAAFSRGAVAKSATSVPQNVGAKKKRAASASPTRASEAQQLEGTEGSAAAPASDAEQAGPSLSTGPSTSKPKREAAIASVPPRPMPSPRQLGTTSPTKRQVAKSVSELPAQAQSPSDSSDSPLSPSLISPSAAPLVAGTTKSMKTAQKQAATATETSTTAKAPVRPPSRFTSATEQLLAYEYGWLKAMEGAAAASSAAR